MTADFMKFPTSREQVLTCGNTSVGVIANICLVSHFQVGAWQVLYRPEETGNVKRWGLPLMIPNFSRLQDGIFKHKGTTLPMHGFGRNLPWSIVEQDGTHLRIQLNSSDATRPSYPYEFTFTANIVTGEGILTYTLTMENHSDEEMPIAPGFHPYFRVAQQNKPRLIVDGPPGFKVGAFDWDKNPPDNPYPFPPLRNAMSATWSPGETSTLRHTLPSPHQVTIQVPQQGTLTIEELPQDGVYRLAVMQVWSEPASKPDHDFVCFEPTVGSEDALNRPTDRLTIAPHSSQEIVLQLTARLL